MSDRSNKKKSKKQAPKPWKYVLMGGVKRKPSPLSPGRFSRKKSWCCIP